MADKALQPIEQKQVNFYGDELTAVKLEDEQVYVSIRHMCQALDIDHNAQQQRIRRHTVLNNGRRACKLHALGKRSQQTVFVLRVDLVPLWLSGIRTSTVNEEARPKLERFQIEAAKVLWEAFQDGRLTADPMFDDLLTQDTPEVKAYKMIQGMLHLARNQILLKAQITDHETRLEAIEARLGDPRAHITTEQAHNISQSVRAVAMAWSKKTKGNEYGRTYGEFYRKFGISAYRELPAAKYDVAMSWLNDWLQELTEDAF